MARKAHDGDSGRDLGGNLRKGSRAVSISTLGIAAVAATAAGAGTLQHTGCPRRSHSPMSNLYRKPRVPRRRDWKYCHNCAKAMHPCSDDKPIQTPLLPMSTL